MEADAQAQEEAKRRELGDRLVREAEARALAETGGGGPLWRWPPRCWHSRRWAA